MFCTSLFISYLFLLFSLRSCDILCYAWYHAVPTHKTFLCVMVRPGFFISISDSFKGPRTSFLWMKKSHWPHLKILYTEDLKTIPGATEWTIIQQVFSCLFSKCALIGQKCNWCILTYTSITGWDSLNHCLRIWVPVQLAIFWSNNPAAKTDFSEHTCQLGLY